MTVQTEQRLRAKPKPWHLVLLAACSFLFMLAVIELPAMLNLIDYEGLEFRGIWGDLRFIRVADPELTHLEPPHAHHVGSSRGGDFAQLYQIPESDQSLYHWDLKYDHNGFRNDQDLRTADIAVIGDSMVEGMTVPDNQLTTSVLADLQHKVVANLGQFGFGPQQELIVLKRYGLQLKPRTIVWMFTESNDLADLIGYRQIALHPQNSWDFFVQRSFTRLLYRSVKRVLAPPKPSGVIRSGVLQTPDGTSRRMYFTYAAAAEPLTGDRPDAIRQTADIVADASHLGNAQNARTIFVFVPDKFRVLHDFCKFPAASECRNWVPNNLPEQMRIAVLSAVPGIGYVDLTSSMVDATKTGVLPYYTDDIHLSPDGHRIAAEAINNYLNSQR